MRSMIHRSALSLVAVLGLSVTTWVTYQLYLTQFDQLELRFQHAAQERADRISHTFDEPLKQFSFLQRLFHSDGDIEKPAFDQFVDPLIGQAGMIGFGWAPLVESADRALFERTASKLWQKNVEIFEFGEQGVRTRVSERERYFPVLYNLSAPDTYKVPGLDLYAPTGRRALVARAIDSGSPVSSGVVLSYVNPNSDGKTVIFFAPVYRDGKVPAAVLERQASTRGVLVTSLDIDHLFQESNLVPVPSQLRAIVFDAALPSNEIARWEPENTLGVKELYLWPQATSQTYDLPGWGWKIRIEPTPAWLNANAPSLINVFLVALAGILLTTLLLLYLRRLLVRSALADTLAIAHAQNIEERRQVEDWANKLFLAVEQNPATVYITDAEGRFEYVNDYFLTTPGYVREEVLGQPTTILRPEQIDQSAYIEMWACVRQGESWQGELQVKRRDGSLFWERVLFLPLKDGDGRLTNVVAIKENITELREVMQRLQESERRFRAATSAMVEGLAVIDPEGRFVFTNRALEAFLESAPGGLLGRRPDEIDIERLGSDGSGCPSEAYPVVYSLREGQELRNVVFGLRYQNGSVRWIEINSSLLPMGADGQRGLVATLSDITERRQVEEQLRLAFEAIRQSGEGILMTDAGHRILSVNPAFEATTGYSAAEVIGKVPTMLASRRHEESFYAEMQAHIEKTGHWQGEVWNQRKNGDAYPEWLCVSVVQTEAGQAQYYVYIYSDMTERMEAQARIDTLVYHDPLTGLPNRLLLRDRVEQAMVQAARQQNRVALLFLDLDRFKTINDSLGHPVGDELLKEVVARLKRCVRESDTISRQGGDEFIIVLNDVRDSDAVSRVAEKIHQQMGEPFEVERHFLTTSFSIGVAIYPDDGLDFDTLLKKADTAMYHAKEAGRSGHRFFTEQMNQRVVEHLTLETQLRRAMENQEFVLHYQPQMDLQEGTIVGVEALIRWNSPENGLVSPARFIPVAEETGLIVPIGAWVLREACRQAREWQEAGLHPLVMAVNLSAVQFRHHDLINSVINALVLSDLDSQWLELELTESILIQDAETTLDAVRRLKALGLKLSVDDFGTGYSSLTYLKRFSVDKLKIDQSFVRDLSRDPEDAAIVRAIIQMAHSLRLKTIAEGVENEELANMLRFFHCDEIQGYWLARPMPAGEMELFLRSHQARNVHGVQGSLL